MKKFTAYLLAFSLFFLVGCQCSHIWIDAGCETPQICMLCKEAQGEPSGHKWEPATCTKPLVCSQCGKTDGAALGHSWGEASCTAPATCYTCGLTTGEAKNHSVAQWSVTSDPSCSAEGTEQGQCTLCNEMVERSIEPTDHTPGEWTVTVEATESAPGKKELKCVNCNVIIQSEEFTLSAAEIEANYKNKCKKISYDELSRYPDKYKGEYVKFYGKVVQVCSEAKSQFYYSTYRVATSGSYNNVIYIYVDNYGSDGRILEDDWITIYGKYDGLYTYETVMGSSLTIPSIKVEYVN